MIDQAVESCGKRGNELGDLRTYVIPIDDIVNLLQTFIDTIRNIRSKPFPVFVLDQFFNLVCNPLQGTFDWNLFEHIFWRWTGIFSCGAGIAVVFSIIIPVDLINRAEISL